MNKTNAGARGFTLIELLVVIVVIGLLAAIIIPSIAGAMRSAKNAKAMSQITALDGAIKRFYAEHGKMPTPKGEDFNPDNDGVYHTANNGLQQSEIVRILLNMDDAWGPEERNTKQMSFLDLDPKSVLDQFGDPCKTDVEMRNALEAGQPVLDPWGTPYGILMDLNMDDKIVGTGYGSGTPEEIRAKVGVFSMGDTNKTYEVSPPFKTW